MYSTTLPLLAAGALRQDYIIEKAWRNVREGMGVIVNSIVDTKKDRTQTIQTGRAILQCLAKELVLAGRRVRYMNMDFLVRVLGEAEDEGDLALLEYEHVVVGRFSPAELKDAANPYRPRELERVRTMMHARFEAGLPTHVGVDSMVRAPNSFASDALGPSFMDEWFDRSLVFRVTAAVAADAQLEGRNE